MEKYSGTKTGYLQLPISDKTVISELSGDFTLPDYQPEIKRLLKVSATILPPSKYIGDREAEFAGGIDYYVLYIGSDNELYCAPLSAEYKINFAVERGEGENESLAVNTIGEIVSTADMISGRVTAPRKISIKCRLKSRARLFGDIALDNSFGEGNDTVQVLEGTADVTRISQSAVELVRVSDEMICDSRDGDVRVISADGRVMMTEVTSSTGSVSCRGDVYLKLLLCGEDGSQPHTALRKMPFSCSLQADGAEPVCGACAKGTVSEMNITVEEGRIGIDVGIMVEAEVCRNQMVSYVKDVYSTERKVENNYKDLTAPAIVSMICGNFTLSDSLTIEDSGLSQGMKIIDVSGSATVDEYNLDGGKCTVSGKAKFTLLAEKDGEYSVTDVELPYNYRTNLNGDFDRVVCYADIVNARARVDGERMGIDAEVCISGNAMGIGSVRMLSSSGFGDEIIRERGEYVICYPSSDDTLWSVAKRYGVTAQSVALANGIDRESTPDSRDSLRDKSYLII